MRRQPIHRGRRGGFTLVEMMVVVIIIGIMSAAILAEMHGTLQDALLKATSRDLISAFNVAGSRAIAMNRPHRIRLDTVRHRYYLEKSARGGLDFIPVRDVPGSEGALDERISIHIREPGMAAPEEAGPEAAAGSANDPDLLPIRGGGEIGFYPDGTADAREIDLEDRDGYRLALRINPITARVQIIEPEPK